MLSPHTSAAIAQTVFYVPAVPLAFYILIRNWSNRPRLAWYPLIPFSLMRLVGGIIVILLASKPENIGLIIAAIVLLNVGMIPLIISTIFLIRWVIDQSFEEASKLRKITKFLRIAVMAAVGLLAAGGGVSGSNPKIGTALAQAGYIVFAAILAICIAIMGYLRVYRADNVGENLIYINWALLAMPPLVLRAIAGLLYEFAGTQYSQASLDSIWNPLYGNAIAFCLMTLLPEYIVLVIFMYLGFHRIRTCSRKQQELNSEVQLQMKPNFK